MVRKKIQLILIALSIFSCAPEAPHDNALDPYHQIAGQSGIHFLGEVIQKTEPHSPLNDCLVLILPEQHFDTTNTNGRFEFTNLLPGLHRIIVSRAGFDTDTFQVVPDTVERSPVHFLLNAKPVIKKVKVYSQYIDQWWPDPVVFVNFEIIIGDSDGISDIEDVQVEIPALNLSYSFSETSRPDSFFLQLSEIDIPGNDIFQLIGKEIYFVVSDKSNSRVVSNPHFIIRIIDTSPETIEPTGLQIVNPQPVLQWKPYLTSYSFSYEVSVFVVTAGIPVLIHTQKGIESSVTQYQYPDSLSAGTYFWTIAVRDELWNLSRSKEASFVVQ